MQKQAVQTSGQRVFPTGGSVGTKAVRWRAQGTDKNTKGFSQAMQTLREQSTLRLHLFQPY